jgi:3-oxoacyl-[acyl-carrier-protein] synthase I
MSSQSVAILNTGLVSSVGLSAPSACAAMRAGLSNPVITRFIDNAGNWILAHEVPLGEPLQGRARLARMAALAIEECLIDIPHEDWSQIPLLLCVAERERPGRMDGLDGDLFLEIQQQLQTQFAEESQIIPYGRVSVGTALLRARGLLTERSARKVLIAATDSLLTWPTLDRYDRAGRLLNSSNSNGFMPGEGAGALLVGAPGGGAELVCCGMGFGIEAAHIDAEQPLRGDGLTQAVNAALAEAGREMKEMDLRITDLSGEQYYFKEAALVLARILRTHKEEFDIWHPAECTGEQGAAAGASVIALAHAACRKAFSRGRNILVHFANDAGQRAALTLEFRNGR